MGHKPLIWDKPLTNKAISGPGPAFTEHHNRPLLERNPTGFWRGVALLSLLANLALLYLLHRGQ